MGHPEEIKRFTLAEYLELEAETEYKSEFQNGEIWAMSGGTPAHAVIASNCARAIGNRLEGKNCRVFDSSLMVHVERINAVLYPDVSVICAAPELVSGSKVLVVNPQLILEVLSESTAKYNRGSKFFQYQMIPSLHTYVLVEEKEPRVHVCTKDAHGHWEVSDFFGMDALVQLPLLETTIPMAEIYRWVEF